MKNFPYDERDYSFGQAMLTLRSAIGLTQEDLGERLGVSRRTIGTWEAGSKYPNAAHLKHFLTIAFKQGAFHADHEADEIRRFWRAARQKVLLDEEWLGSLLDTHANDGINTFTVDMSAPHQPQSEATKLRSLPLPPTRFFGRTTEMAELSWILGDPHCRLLTVLGPGGIGKTRLALEYAANQTDHYTQGVVFVPLAAVNSSEHIASAVNIALNVRESGAADPTKILLSMLRDRHLLLILDNFEHLLDGADLISAIIAAAPQVTILVTSRERLNLQAEWLFRVDGLNYPTEDFGSETAAPDPANYSALQLFIQRATQIQLSFAPDDAMLKSIAAICQHIAGMPLAIELAAANTNVLSLDKIEQELRGGVAILTTPLQDVPARHRSLRGVFDQSWGLLNDAEQQLLSRMSVFRGSCIFEAAAQIAGATQLTLTALIDKSLVRPLDPPQPPNTGLPVLQDMPVRRFVLLEPIREYAWEKLMVQGGVATVQYLHATYYLALAESLAAQWENPESNKALDRDYNNMRAVLTWVRDGGDSIMGLRLATALNRFWDRRGYYNEGQKWLGDLLAQAERHSNPDAMRVRFGATRAAAWLAADQHDYARATQLYDQSVQLRRLLGESEIEVDIHDPQTRVGRIIGQYDLTISALEGALAKHRSGNNPGTWDSGSIGMTLYELGLAVREQGDYDRASALIEESIALHRSLNDPEGVAIGMLALSDLARDRADAAGIRRWALQALDFFRDQEIRWALGFTLMNLATAAYIERDWKQATALSDEGVSIFRLLNDDANLAEGLITQGHVTRVRGNTQAAFAIFMEALNLTLAVGPRLMVVQTLEGLAGLVAQAGEVKRGVHILAAAAALRMQMRTPRRPLDLLLEIDALTNAPMTLGESAFTAAWQSGQTLSPETIADQLIESDTFDGVLVQRVTASPARPKTDQADDDTPHATPVRTQLFDWADALDIPAFHGRDAEMATISRWIGEEQCRVVSLLGMAGAGKSALAAKCMHQVAPGFDVVMWRSLHDAPDCDTLLDSCLQLLEPLDDGNSSVGFERRLTLLLDHMRSRRVLLVLDNLETILEEGLDADHARLSDDKYSRFLRRVAETPHQSCVIFTSRQQPRDLMALESSNAHVRAWRLTPLDAAAGDRLLSERNLRGSARERAHIVEAYGGNPLALQIVSQTIVDLFDGDIGLFLEQGQIIFGSVQELLDQQFARLSPVEQSVLLWLAILRESATFDDILRVVVTPLPRLRLLEAIESLHRYSMIERGAKPASFILQSVVLKYVTARITTTISWEIEHASPRYLTAYSLTYALSPEHVRQAQLRLLVAPLLTSLCNVFADPAALEKHLVGLLDTVRGQSVYMHGYSPANIVVLLQHLRGGLSGLDLSHLLLRGAYIGGVAMQDTTLADSLLHDVVIAGTVGANASGFMDQNRPYERLNIKGVQGLTDAQRAALQALGAIEA